MERINHVLPDWTRTQWTSIENKTKYEPILNSIISAWRTIERMSVVHDLRLSTLDIIGSNELEPLTNEYKQYGVHVVPLAREGVSMSYSSTSTPYETGKPYNIRVVFTKSEELAKEWYALWNTAPLDNRRVGQLLGYPECCIDFYLQYWVEQRFVDTSWVMAVHHIQTLVTNNTIHIKPDTPLECNILWRWQGVRLVSHLPCSFECKHTQQIGHANALLGHKLGFETEVNWIYEFLSWPVEWSGLHGIAEIRTPINKVSSRTDMTPWKYVVQKQSNFYPEDGASGITYPYSEKKLKINPITKSKSFLRSLEDTSVWEENGFRYKEAMDHFHEVVIEAIGNMKYIPSGNVLDLGCGNGVLLGRVVTDRNDLIPHGVELDRQRCMSAATTIHWGFFTMGDIFDLTTWTEDYYSMVLLMPGRLLETTQEKVVAFRKQLYEKTDTLIINLTCDWTQKYKTIDNIMKVTGLDTEWEPDGPIIHRQDDLAQKFKRKI